MCSCGWSFPAGNCDNCHYDWSTPYFRIVHDLSTARADAGLATSIGEPVAVSNSSPGGYGYTEPAGVVIVSRVVGNYSDLLFRAGHATVAIGHGFGYTF